MTWEQKSTEVALAHHRLVKMRGVEKKPEQFSTLFPSALICTPVAVKKKLSPMLQRHSLRVRSKKAVLTTGAPDLMSTRKGMENGSDDFLPKPFSHEALPNFLEARLNCSSVNWRVEDKELTQLRSSIPPKLPQDFFSPMAGIIGLMEILQSGAATLTSEEVREIHHNVYYSAVRLNRALRNYLQILALQATSPEPLLGSLSARQVENNIQAGVKVALKLNKRREDITFRISDCSLVVKPEDLSRIVEELIDNSCRYSCQGTPVNLDLDANGRLTVTDQGKGLTSEEISQIGAFQQFDRERYEQQGLGLGLILVQKLSATCGATFSIASQPGNGTQVQITFPLEAKGHSNDE
jgi:two-component system, sensor histidine kinase and response regulator